MQNQIHDHCEQPFWKDPMILFRHFTLEYRPTCSHSPFNFTARLVILSLFVGIIGSLWGGLSFLMVGLVFGLLTAMVIIMTTPMNDETRDMRNARNEQRNVRNEQRRPDDEWHTLPFQAVVNPSTHVKEHPHHEKQKAQQARQQAQQQAQQQVTEHFVNGGADPRSVQPVSPMGLAAIDAFPYSGCPLPDHTPPTSRNPFMNILLDDIKYHPQRPAASPVDQPDVAQTMDDYFRIQWFSDPTDVFGKNQGQRQFITQPSTTVPNDQGSFADWLYKIPGKTCKEGGRAACQSGSDGGVLPWLSHSS
jgi:hypothetical protein